MFGSKCGHLASSVKEKYLLHQNTNTTISVSIPATIPYSYSILLWFLLCNSIQHMPSETFPQGLCDRLWWGRKGRPCFQAAYSLEAVNSIETQKQ